MHHHRAEHWVTQGTAWWSATAPSSWWKTDTYIPMGCKHRLSNPGRIPVELIKSGSTAARRPVRFRTATAAATSASAPAKTHSTATLLAKLRG